MSQPDIQSRFGGSVAVWGTRLKFLAVLVLYAWGTFIAAAFITSALPDQYTMGVLVGWIVSLWLGGQLIRSHFHI